MAINNTLKDIREERNLVQADLAKAVGSCSDTIGRIERGERNASLEIAIRLAHYLKMPVEEIFQTMSELVAEQFAMEPAEVTMDTSFEEDLGADSVDLVDLVMAMEEEFEVGEIQEEDLKTLKTVGDAVNYIASKVKS